MTAAIDDMRIKNPPMVIEASSLIALCTVQAIRYAEIIKFVMMMNKPMSIETEPTRPSNRKPATAPTGRRYSERRTMSFTISTTGEFL